MTELEWLHLEGVASQVETAHSCQWGELAGWQGGQPGWGQVVVVIMVVVVTSAKICQLHLKKQIISLVCVTSY